MKKTLFVALLALTTLTATAQAELRPLADDSLSDVSGQGGVYLSGEFSINKANARANLVRALLCAGAATWGCDWDREPLACRLTHCERRVVAKQEPEP